MMDISTPEILTNLQKIFRDPDTNFPRNGKFQNPNFSGKFPALNFREETLSLPFNNFFIKNQSHKEEGLATMPLLKYATDPNEPF